jgi:hypothetical protein
MLKEIIVTVIICLGNSHMCLRVDTGAALPQRSKYRCRYSTNALLSVTSNAVVVASIVAISSTVTSSNSLIKHTTAELTIYCIHPPVRFNSICGMLHSVAFIEKRQKIAIALRVAALSPLPCRPRIQLLISGVRCVARAGAFDAPGSLGRHHSLLSTRAPLVACPANS